MRFEIRHLTEYVYETPGLEAYGELRLTPPDTESQRVLDHSIRLDPEVPVSEYVDHHGNRTGFFAVPFRHSRLAVENRLVVETRSVPIPAESLAVPISETRQILRAQLPDHFGYLQFTPSVEPVPEATRWARRFLSGRRAIGEGLEALNDGIHAGFRYESGVTQTTTRLAEVWRHRRGVCQDFAQAMLGVLRAAALPARYVCGYIETDPPPDGRRMRGAAATHAWVEVLLPGLIWAALDPTNRQWCGERHVAVSRGRDYREAAPLRGTFKGSGGQRLNVSVTMRRLSPGGEASS